MQEEHWNLLTIGKNINILWQDKVHVHSEYTMVFLVFLTKCHKQ